MNELTVFKNPKFGEIRIVVIDGEPWWVLSDVCKVLEIARGSRIAERLEEDEVRQTYITDSIGRSQSTYIVNEPGLYSVILRSDKPQAKPFRKWVTGEVLPTIRKHGAYMSPDVLELSIQNPDYMIGLLQQLKEEQEQRKSLETTVAVLEQQNAELQPKASYYDVILNCKDAIAIGVIAKDYGMSAKKLNKLLHELGVQFKQGGIWLLYQKYAEQGYTSTKTQSYNGTKGEIHSKVHTYWTQKGRMFIYDLLKKNGHLPTIEEADKDDCDSDD